MVCEQGHTVLISTTEYYQAYASVVIWKQDEAIDGIEPLLPASCARCGMLLKDRRFCVGDL
jgi:hypothetical protein